MVIEPNVGEETRVTTATANHIHSDELNRIGSLENQNKRSHQTAPPLDTSNRFAALSSAEIVSESSVPTAANNGMDVEATLPAIKRTIVHGNMEFEILQPTSGQISDPEPAMIQHTPTNTLPSTTNEEEACDTDSLGSDWDYDGAPTYDHELRRSKQSPEKSANTPVTQKKLPTRAKKSSNAALPLRRSKSCSNFIYTPITKNRSPPAPSVGCRRQKAARA